MFVCETLSSGTPAKRKDLEENAREWAELRLLCKMNQHLKVNMSDLYGVILSSPRGPSRAAIRSNHLLLVSVPTLRRYSSGVGSAKSALIEMILGT